MICHESDAMQPVPLTFERLPKKVTMAPDEETIGTKMMSTLHKEKKVDEPKTPCTSMVDEYICGTL